MKSCLTLFVAILILQFGSAVLAQSVKSDIRYLDPGHGRHVLDVYSPDNAKNAPVVFWIHGGGWQTGDKTNVHQKPQVFADKGCVLVSTNYRLLPEVDMQTIVQDVAKAVGWVHSNIAEFGGDPSRIFIMGHSAGAQLAALICIDERYLKAAGVPMTSIIGCVPVDGETAETRRRVHGLPQLTFVHREKFGNTPEMHRELSAVTHVAQDKTIPPFLILHVANHPDNTAQAQRLGNVLKEAGKSVKVFGAKETTHTRINAELGNTGDLATEALNEFMDKLLKR
jgi:arylformamidase